MTTIRNLYFDVGGTVFDWKTTVKNEITTLADTHGHQLDSEAFAVDWRSSMFKIHNKVRNGKLPWMNSDNMHLMALEEMTSRFPLINDIDKEGLIKSTWHKLDVFPGAPEAIERLRSNYTVMVLTILNMESIVASSKQGNVIWDGIFSCDLLGHYKPSLEAYEIAIHKMGRRPEETAMVAAHMGDLAAAAQVGMHTVFVQVPEEDHVGEGFTESEGIEVDYMAADFDSLCSYFGVRQRLAAQQGRKS